MSESLEVEVNEQGSLLLTAEVLGHVEPHRRYRVDRQGDTVVLRPARDDTERFPEGRTTWRDESPQQRLAALRELLRDSGSQAGLSDEAVSRDSIYD